VRSWRAGPAAALLGVLLVAACGQPQGSGPAPNGSPSSGPLPSAAPTPLPLKPVLGGLLTRDGPPPAAYLPVVGGYVVNVHWADLQPTAGGPIVSGNAIDQALQQLHQLDPQGRLGLKIRLFAGIWSPDWAKSLGGAPIPVRDPTTGATGTVGRFWTADFGQAYQDLQSKLAALYDGVPEIREVTISRCTTVYAEPFIRDANDSSTVAALEAAGFTTEADHACIAGQITAHRVWARTRSDLSFNPYQILGGGAGQRIDEPFSESMMDTCRATLGNRCVLENNSLRTPPLYATLYAKMQSVGPPLSFQTATLDKVGDLGQTLDYAVSAGAGSVELPAGFDSVPVPRLADYDNKLIANALLVPNQ